MKHKPALISLLMAIIMTVGVFASCSKVETPENGIDKEDTSQKVEATETEKTSEKETDKESTSQKVEATESEKVQETHKEYDTYFEPEYTGNTSGTVELGDALANKVQSYYNTYRDVFTMENSNTVIDYNMNRYINGYVDSLRDKNGNEYIEKTMDVFVMMNDGSKYYASESVVNPSMNINRLGYYYYENRIDNQIFVEADEIKELEIKHTAISNTVNIERESINTEDNTISFRLTSNTDPQLYLPKVKFVAEEYQYLELTLKAYEGISPEIELFIWTDNYEYYSSEQRMFQEIIVDGMYHTYVIPMNAVKDYTGDVKGIRIDVNGLEGSEFAISNIKVVSVGNAPRTLSLRRSFLMYSDKIHHITQVAATEKTENIASIGNEIKIPVEKVSGMVIKDARGWHYYCEDKISWSNIEYFGFMIDGVGVVGFILPQGENNESFVKIGYDESGENYIVEISRVPSEFTIKPSEEKTENANDFVMGYRIYTDNESSFDKFIYEAECEINPLGEENFNIDVIHSGESFFMGYDPLRGYYKFNIDVAGGFNGPYYQYPNKHFGMRFTVIGDDKNRTCYIVGYTAGGSLECSVVLDEKNMLIPVPVQVGKNFHGDGDDTIFDLDDTVYGEALLPISIAAGGENTYKLLHLYQNWGCIPLKQISSIQFHSPYYHLSLGVTETNCVMVYHQRGLGLPDFRACSAPLWKDQPQHNSCGTHVFVQYTDSQGRIIKNNSTGSYIDSHGPTYAEMTQYFTSEDSHVNFTYTHLELPQTDENRTFYQLDIDFVYDLAFENFKEDFVIYKVRSTDTTGLYQRVGYLNENNVCSVTDANRQKGTVKEYVLGDKCPYFTFFYMENCTADWTEGYSNPACLIYQSSVTVNGEEKKIPFIIRDDSEYLSLTLDVSAIEFKAGDSITIDGILLPWGSQELDNQYDSVTGELLDLTSEGKYFYDSVIDTATGEKYQDKNVRDVREDSLFSPMTLTAGNGCEKIDSVFLPRGRTTNGKSAEFSVKGGANNIAVRIYGFDTLTVPCVEELINGEWKTLDLSSSSKPDRQGYGYLYDGYTVYKDDDGSYSYAFSFDIGEGDERTFRITADGEFEGFEEKDPFADMPLNVYIASDNITSVGTSLDDPFGCGKYENNLEGGFFRFWGDGESREMFVVPYKERPFYTTTGQYAVIKYRIPTANTSETIDFQVFASCTTKSATGDGDCFNAYNAAVADGEWHVVVFDLSSISKYTPDENGQYRALFMRFDIMNATGPIPETDYIDVEYFGISDSLEDICALNADMKEILVCKNNTLQLIDPNTGSMPEPDESRGTGLKVYRDPKDIASYKAFGCTTELEANEEYVRFTANGSGESFVIVYSNPSTPITSGQYAVFKYRIPEGSVGNLANFELFASTTLNEPTGGSSMKFNGVISDGNWQVMIVDLSGIETYIADSEGNYKAKHLRIDIIDKRMTSEFFIDLAYIGIHGDIDEIKAFCTEKENITFVDKDKSHTVIQYRSEE